MITSDLSKLNKNSNIFVKINFFIDYLVSIDDIVSLMKNKVIEPKKSRAQKRAKVTLEKLKEAALDAFSEKSINAVTVEEITEKANVGKGTLYQHFEEILFILLILRKNVP